MNLFGIFLFFLFLLWYSRNKSKVDGGEVFLLYLILYSVARLFIEGLRTDSLMWGGPIRVAQLISIIGIIIPAAILYNKKKTILNVDLF